MNIEKFKTWIVKTKVLFYLINPIYKVITYPSKLKKCTIEFKKLKRTIKENPGKGKVWYFGIPSHQNMGDIAQYYCIKEWITKNYPTKKIVGISVDLSVNRFIMFNKYLKQEFQLEKDIVIFQSGYCTTDLGGDSDKMHQLVIQTIPEARILMMPQTVNYISLENQNMAAKRYCMAKNMLFLARDRISYEKATNIFKSIRVVLFPDIVTTLIGTKKFETERSGVLLCLRNDLEKFYSKEDIKRLESKLKGTYDLSITDTTKNHKICYEDIEKEFEYMSKFKAVITDRYHGTIFSLISNTPVIVLKTNDHKVRTGVDWFKDIYNDYVFYCENIDDIFVVLNHIYETNYTYRLKNAFKKDYYDNLKKIFEYK